MCSHAGFFFNSSIVELLQEQFFKLKQEGNALFSQGSYEQALGYYYKALNYCRKHNMKPEVMAVVRANCAQACLKLQQYRDAYTHADQCLMLNPKSHKVCVCVPM